MCVSVSKVDMIEKQFAGLRYDNRSLFDLLENIGKQIDKFCGPGGANIHSENQCLMEKSILLTVKDDDELQELETKLINNDLPEFRAQFVS